jgi:hypothetical protein
VNLWFGVSSTAVEKGYASNSGHWQYEVTGPDLLARSGQGEIHYLALPFLGVAGDTLKVDGLVIDRLKNFLLSDGCQMKAL